MTLEEIEQRGWEIVCTRGEVLNQILRCDDPQERSRLQEQFDALEAQWRLLVSGSTVH